MEPELINPDLNDAELLQKLNSETAQIPWKELENHFARGVVVRVDSGLDLVQVAMSFSRDDRNGIEKLMAENKVGKACDDEALRWNRQQSIFWAIVIAPWVLIQEQQ